MKQAILLISIFIFAFFSRFSLLNYTPASLFSDEVDIGYQVKSLLTTGKDYYGNFLPLQFHSFSDVRTSLPIYATALISKIPGISLDIAIRLTPAIFSLLTIIVVYFLINDLFDLYALSDKKSFIKPGVWGSLILTLLPWHYTYSRTGFELSMLFFFFALGIFLFLRYLISSKNSLLIASMIVLSLTPMVYSTAKLAVIFYPILLLLIPGSSKHFWKKKTMLFFLILFIPLGLLFLNGGAGQRFSEISIFTDPTIVTQTNYLRKQDLGPSAAVGSGTGIFSKIAHNKIIFIGQNFLRNVINPLSFGYLFLAGDTNPRHAVQGWGMLLKILLIPIVYGLYKLSASKKINFLCFLGVLALLAILPAALTRDGWNHSSRNFLLIIPLVLVIAYAIDNIAKLSRLLLPVFLLLLFFESFLYFHDYWYHYRYDSERDFHAGLKEAVLFSRDFKDTPVVITRKYEPPLIFYLYYADFPPAKFQEMAKANNFYVDIDPALNLEGKRFGDTNVYFASVQDATTKDPIKLKNGLYILMTDETRQIPLKKNQTPMMVSTLPSGEILFYGILN